MLDILLEITRLNDAHNFQNLCVFKSEQLAWIVSQYQTYIIAYVLQTQWKINALANASINL